MARGKFITLEGCEGSGKTTNLQVVCDYLTSRGIAHVVTREPGGTSFAEQVRELLLNPDLSDPPCDDAELLLMFASRSQHVTRLIQPALDRGEWVVSSRFTDSTFAYQGGGRGLPLDRIAALSEWCHGGFSPDLTLLLDLDAEIGLGRARVRGTLDRIEQSGIAFFERVRAAYLARAKDPAHAGRFEIVDAEQPKEVVRAQIEQALAGLLSS